MENKNVPLEVSLTSLFKEAKPTPEVDKLLEILRNTPEKIGPTVAKLLAESRTLDIKSIENEEGTRYVCY
jgi:hypothetical protein